LEKIDFCKLFLQYKVVTRFVYIKMADNKNNDQSVNIDDELSQSEPAENILQNCSQVEPQQETNSLKRQKPESPNEQPYEIKQNERQSRRRLSQSVGPNTRQTSDSAIKTPTGRPIPKQSGAKSTKGPTKREIEIADIVNNSIQSESFVSTLVPMITDAIQHNLELTIRQTISAAITTSMTDMQNIITNQQILLSNQQTTIEGLTNKTKQLDENIESQNLKINDQQNTIDQLKQSVASLDRRLEETEQYSRRTSLRFNSVKLPTKPNGQIIKPINSDQLVLDICNNELGLDLQLQDLGRTHPIGPVHDGKANIIARFISYRPRQQVFSNKRKLKQHQYGTFISENLTTRRYALISDLNKLRQNGDINSCWSYDGRIFAKVHEDSEKTLIKDVHDIDLLRRQPRLQPVEVQHESVE